MKNVFLSLTLLILRMFAVAPQKCILQKAKKYIYLVEEKISCTFEMIVARLSCHNC